MNKTGLALMAMVAGDALFLASCGERVFVACTDGNVFGSGWIRDGAGG